MEQILSKLLPKLLLIYLEPDMQTLVGEAAA